MTSKPPITKAQRDELRQQAASTITHFTMHSEDDDTTVAVPAAHLLDLLDCADAMDDVDDDPDFDCARVGGCADSWVCNTLCKGYERP